MLTILIAQRLIKFATSNLVHANVILVLDLLADNVLVGELTISYLYLYFSFKKDPVKGLFHVDLIHMHIHCIITRNLSSWRINQSFV